MDSGVLRHAGDEKTSRGAHGKGKGCPRLLGLSSAAGSDSLRDGWYLSTACKTGCPQRSLQIASKNGLCLCRCAPPRGINGDVERCLGNAQQVPRHNKKYPRADAQPSGASPGECLGTSGVLAVLCLAAHSISVQSLPWSCAQWQRARVHKCIHWENRNQ